MLIKLPHEVGNRRRIVVLALADSRETAGFSRDVHFFRFAMWVREQPLGDAQILERIDFVPVPVVKEYGSRVEGSVDGHVAENGLVVVVHPARGNVRIETSAHAAPSGQREAVDVHGLVGEGISCVATSQLERNDLSRCVQGNGGTVHPRLSGRESDPVRVQHPCQHAGLEEKVTLQEEKRPLDRLPGQPQRVEVVRRSIPWVVDVPHFQIRLEATHELSNLIAQVTDNNDQILKPPVLQTGNLLLEDGHTVDFSEALVGGVR